MSKPANQDMVDGYMDGRNLDDPEPSANRSASYRHGFMIGRGEKLGTLKGTYRTLIAAADTAMAKDEER